VPERAFAYRSETATVETKLGGCVAAVVFAADATGDRGDCDAIGESGRGSRWRLRIRSDASAGSCSRPERDCGAVVEWIGKNAGDYFDVADMDGGGFGVSGDGDESVVFARDFRVIFEYAGTTESEISFCGCAIECALRGARDCVYSLYGIGCDEQFFFFARGRRIRMELVSRAGGAWICGHRDYGLNSLAGVVRAHQAAKQAGIKCAWGHG